MSPAQYNQKAIDEGLDRFIEYDLYWYSRPNAWTWLISPDYIDGFYPCPACDRGGNILSKWYMGEFMPNDDYRLLNGYNPKVNMTNADARTALRAKGFRLSDYANYNSVAMLALVKYADLNFQYCVGHGWGSGNSPQISSGDNILGDDGYGGTTKETNASIKVMGITDFYGNVWKNCDAIFIYKRSIYVNDDLDNITEWPTIDTWQTMGYKQVNTALIPTNGSYIKEFIYDSQFPWMTFPKTMGGDDTNPVGDMAWFPENDSNMHCVLFGGRRAWGRDTDGAFSWHSYDNLLYYSEHIGCLATAFPK